MLPQIEVSPPPLYMISFIRYLYAKKQKPPLPKVGWPIDSSKITSEQTSCNIAIKTTRVSCIFPHLWICHIVDSNYSTLKLALSSTAVKKPFILCMLSHARRAWFFTFLQPYGSIQPKSIGLLKAVKSLRWKLLYSDKGLCRLRDCHKALAFFLATPFTIIVKMWKTQTGLRDPFKERNSQVNGNFTKEMSEHRIRNIFKIVCNVFVNFLGSW